MAPAGTPQEIVDQLNKAINTAIQTAEVQNAMNSSGLIPVVESAKYFSDFLRSEDKKFEKLVKDIGYEPQ